MPPVSPMSFQRIAYEVREVCNGVELAELEAALLPAPPDEPPVRRRAAATRKAPAKAGGGRARA